MCRKKKTQILRLDWAKVKKTPTEPQKRCEPLVGGKKREECEAGLTPLVTEISGGKMGERPGKLAGVRAPRRSRAVSKLRSTDDKRIMSEKTTRKKRNLQISRRKREKKSAG